MTIFTTLSSPKLALCALVCSPLAIAGTPTTLESMEFQFQTSEMNTAPMVVYLSNSPSRSTLNSAKYVAKSTLGGMCDDDLSAMDAWAAVEGEQRYSYSTQELAYQTADDGSMPFNPFPFGAPAAGSWGTPAIQGDQTFTYDGLTAEQEMILREYDEL